MLNAPDITVVIKAPNQKHEDFPVKCQTSWTIHQLKSRLSESYPTKPSVREQRLIYSGQLLSDESRLQEVLRQHDDHSTVHTVHLVCLPPAEPAASGLRHRRTHQTPVAPPPPAAAAAAAPPAPDPATVAAPLPQPYDLTQWAHMLHNNQHQLLAMQQMYSQYWAQYAQMMQLNPAALPMVWPQPVQMPSQPSAAANDESGPAAAAAAGRPQPPPQQPDPAQNVRLNAQGGVMAEDEEGGGQWDWLDWLHGLSRLAVLFLAVYLYASVSRLLVVMFFGFIAYLYNQGWFQDARLRAPPAAPPAPREQQQQQPPPAAEAVDQADTESDQDPEQNPDQQDGPNVHRTFQQVLDEAGVTPPVVERTHPLTLAWTFFSSFFASLIPDRIEQ